MSFSLSALTLHCESANLSVLLATCAANQWPRVKRKELSDKSYWIMCVSLLTEGKFFTLFVMY